LYKISRRELFGSLGEVKWHSVEMFFGKPHHSQTIPDRFSPCAKCATDNVPKEAFVEGRLRFPELKPHDGRINLRSWMK
jgi:hypothetical protein